MPPATTGALCCGEKQAVFGAEPVPFAGRPRRTLLVGHSAHSPPRPFPVHPTSRPPPTPATEAAVRPSQADSGPPRSRVRAPLQERRTSDESVALPSTVTGASTMPVKPSYGLRRATLIYSKDSDDE